MRSKDERRGERKQGEGSFFLFLVGEIIYHEKEFREREAGQMTKRVRGGIGRYGQRKMER